jgi:tRNA threonylcarbamoyladenosine biosynthesis protein TsaB
MLILAFDTTFETCGVAVIKNKQILAESLCPMAFGQAEALIPNICLCLKKANFSFDDLNLIAVSSGPGSFTGIRVGLAAARALALALNIPCIGVQTPLIMLDSIKNMQNCEEILVVLETKRDDFYFQIFNDKFLPLIDVQTAKSQEIIKLLTKNKILLVGNAKNKFLKETKGIKNMTFFYDSDSEDKINLESLAFLALKDAKNSETFKKPLPVYAKAPDIGGK